MSFFSLLSVYIYFLIFIDILGNVMNKNKTVEMEMEESGAFDLLFRDYNFESAVTVLPLVRKCLSTSRNEIEFVRALEIALCFSLKYFPPNDLEEELFQMVCPPARNFVLDKIKNLEKNPATCFEHLGVVLKVIAYFQGVFEYLIETGKRSLLEVKSLLTVTSEILYCCYCHCKTSEEVYGAHFSSATECLSNFFKNCCSLQEQLLDFLSDKSECDTEDDREILLLDEVLNQLSKSGIVLIHLEVKTMAKVWKTFAGLIQRYTLSLRNNHSIDLTIRELCQIITSKMETALCKDTKDIPKIVKLSCFFLKLIIKFCEVFKGCLKDCQTAILNLLLLLCRCSSSPAGKSRGSESQEVLNQLAVGIDPLMCQLMEEELLVKECCHLSNNSDKSQEFSLLCCLILKKLIDSNGAVRNLWFNESENILQWIFQTASSRHFIVCSNLSLPNILVKGNQKTFTDLYEYVFVSTSAFLMTATSPEYRLIEKTLIQNLLQQHPIRALLAIDLWCLLARFAGPELCFSQIIALGNLFQELRPGTHRPEKWYLRSLIRRLFPLLAQRHRTAFLEAFPPSFHSALWLGRPAKVLTQSEASDVRHSLLSEVERLPETVRRGSEMCERVGKLWRFDCEVLSSSGRSVRFLKIMSAVTAGLVSEMSSELLLMMKTLLAIGQPTPVILYFTWILSALAPRTLPPSNHQHPAITAIAHIFRTLLSSREVPAKGHALSTFLSFARLTSHGEIIPLSVQSAPALKVEVADCLKGRAPEGGERLLGEYLLGAEGARWEHVCEREEEGEGGPGGWKRMRMWGGDAEEVAMRWREDGRRVMECFQELSDAEKRKIKSMCSSILSLV